MYRSRKKVFVYGCLPQLSFPTCSKTSLTSPPIVTYQSSEPRRMYFSGSQKSSWGRLLSLRKLQSSFSRSRLYAGTDCACTEHATTIHTPSNTRAIRITSTSTCLLLCVVDFCDIASRELHHGRVAVVRCVWSGEYRRSSRLGFRQRVG